MGCYKLHNYTTLQIAHTSNTARSREVKSDAGLYKYKYNGKEYQDELGLNVTAMDFRQYDSAIGRFMVIDPMAENATSLSPYRFGFNSPTLFSDPSGLWEEINGGWSTNDPSEIAQMMGAVNRNANKNDDKTKLDIYINADKDDSVLGDSYKEVAKTEDVLTSIYGYSTLKTIDLPSNKKKGWDNLATELSGLMTIGYSFNSFIIDSHGSYTDPDFYIGDSKVNSKNFNSTSTLTKFFKGTSVYILSCHIGGGSDLQKSMDFTQGLANLWGANVYTNRSWGPSWVFNKPLTITSWTNPGSRLGELFGKHGDRTNARELRGQWLMASPGNKTPTIISNLTLTTGSLFNSNITNSHQ